MSENPNPRDSDVVVLVVGADPEVNGAIASIVRGALTGEALETVPMYSYRNNPCYHDYDQYAHKSDYDIMDEACADASDMLNAIYKARPHMFRAFVVGIDVVQGDVSISQQNVEKVEARFHGFKVESEVVQ